MLYIDPGTGGMLFTVLTGIIGTGVYSSRLLLIKMRYRIHGGKAVTESKKIPFVIFSDNKRYWPVFEPICREMDRLGKDILYITASADDPVFDCGYSHITVECIENSNKLFARLNFLNACILLSTTPGLEVYQWKRSRNVDYYVHILHAANESILYRMFGIDYYDAVLLSGEYQAEDIRKLEKLRNLPEKELLQVGIPYMDEMAKRVSGNASLAKHPRTVLLAPSWGDSAIFGVYGSRILDVLLETGYHVIVRPHPQSFISEADRIKGLMDQYPESDMIEWNRDTDNFEVLCRADILISDFSGIIFEFTLVHNKPVIYTNPNFDLGMYDAWWLDAPIWTVSALPRIGCELTADNMDSLKELIDTCIEDQRYEKGRQEVKAETWVHAGEGAVRATDYLIHKYEELSAGKEE